jgi:5-methylcytosine-specific restriction enzyme A
MALRETLQQILAEYAQAKSEPLEGHPLARFIRSGGENSVADALGELGGGLIVQGSPGQGNWAAVPWISVFDPAITTSATRRYYVVYLFHATQPLVHLSLNQGTTAVRDEFANKARAVLTDRAEFMRKRVADFAQALAVVKIDLGSPALLPGDYVAGHALGATYTLTELPDEMTLRLDLQTAVRAYRALTFRGGIEGDVEGQSEISDEFNIPSQVSVIETRKYSMERLVRLVS